MISLHEVLQKVFGFCNGVDYDFRISEWTFYIHRWNGIITIQSSEDPKNLAGANAASVHIEEASLQPFAVYGAAKERCRHPDAKHPCVTISSTPDGLGWLFDLIEGDKKPAEIFDVRAKTSDNFYLPANYIADLIEMYGDGPLLEAYLNGQFVNISGGSAYHGYASTRNNWINPDPDKAKEPYQPDPTLPISIGFDFNWTPNTAILFQEVAGKIIVFREYFLINTSTENKCKRIIEDYPGFYFEIYMDATGKNRTARVAGTSDLVIVGNTFLANNVSHRILVDSKNPKRIDRLNSVNAKLANGSILICKSCKHLLEDLRKIGHDEFINESIKDTMLGHISDSLGYPIFYKWPIRSTSKSKARSRFTI